MEYKRLTKENLCYSEWAQKGNSPSELYYVLKELEDKIENGTLRDFPCKVGDTVYWVFELVKNKLEILEGKVRGISISQNNTSWFSVIYEYGLTFEHTFKDYWNKTIFPTKDKAEQRLKELQNEL